jgi:hypothetical protein
VENKKEESQKQYYSLYCLSNKEYYSVDYIIDICPYCKKTISIKLLDKSKINVKQSDKDIFAFIFKCPDAKCGKIIISHYYYDSDKPFDENMHFVLNARPFRYIESFPALQFQKIQFSSIIQSTSLQFCTLYNQSATAEHYSCKDIAGAGYRKTLEFLVKDYLIKLNPQKKDDIKKSFLGDCIQTYIKHEKIKNISQRAAWLGNDETHYERLWETKDISDLKYLISLLVSYIELEIGSDNIIAEMQK